MGEFTEEYPDDVVTEPEPKPEPEPEPEPKPEPDPEPEKEAEPVDRETVIQERAREQGWVPLEEWRGDPAEWRPAEFFLERGEYFSKMKHQSGKIEQLERQLEMMASQQGKIREQERKKTIAELKKEKIAHMESGEYDKVLETDEKIAEVEKEEDEKPTVTPEQKAAAEKVEAFVKENSWYTSDTELREYADTVGNGYLVRNPKASVDDVLEYTKKEVKARFPDKFREAPARSPVGESTPSPSRKKEKSMRDLDDDHRAILKKFIEADETGRTKEQIIKETIKDWEEIGEI